MKTFTLVCLMLLSIQVSATHLRGGYIQARSVSTSATSYEITVTLYLDEITGQQASNDFDKLSLCLGDGTTQMISRQSRRLTTDRSLSINVYRTVHTYSGPGTYSLAVALPNRTIARNIRQADQTTMALTTTLLINNTGINQTPTLVLSSGSFLAATNQRYTLALNAADTDGDSIVYSLSKALTNPSTKPCERQLVASYQYPNDLNRQGTFKLNSRTGNLTWDAPVEQGNYSVVAVVGEYRNGILLSQTTVEILLTVTDRPGTPNPLPPYEPALETTVVTALPDYRDEDVLFTVFPNPVDDRLQVVIQTSSAATATVQLTDVNGRKLHELAFRKASRQHEQVIGMGSLSPGQYILRANVGGRSLVRKVLKK